MRLLEPIAPERSLANDEAENIYFFQAHLSTWNVPEKSEHAHRKLKLLPYVHWGGQFLRVQFEAVVLFLQEKQNKETNESEKIAKLKVGCVRRRTC